PPPLSPYPTLFRSISPEAIRPLSTSLPRVACTPGGQPARKPRKRKGQEKVRNQGDRAKVIPGDASHLSQSCSRLCTFYATAWNFFTSFAVQTSNGVLSIKSCISV